MYEKNLFLQYKLKCSLTKFAWLFFVFWISQDYLNFLRNLICPVSELILSLLFSSAGTSGVTMFLYKHLIEMFTRMPLKENLWHNWYALQLLENLLCEIIIDFISNYYWLKLLLILFRFHNTDLNIPAWHSTLRFKC